MPIVKRKLYALTYIPKKRGFAVNELKKGDTIQKRYEKNTSYVRAKSGREALNLLSKRSYKQETGRRLR